VTLSGSETFGIGRDGRMVSYTLGSTNYTITIDSTSRITAT
jgi:hypothetical protein